MHTHFLFFSTFLFFCFSTFFIFFLGLGPTQPTWAGLDPASPARSLAQASDPAGQKLKNKSTRELITRA
jgi:hypothetical protein